MILRRSNLWFLFLVVILPSCFNSEITFTPAPATPLELNVDSADTSVQMTPTPYPTSTIPSWPTPDGKQTILPAPIYFISAQDEGIFGIDSQVVRIERDGTHTTISHPVHKRINGFDLSPSGDSIVLATQGSLWLMEIPTGSVRRLLKGLPNPEGTDSLFEVRDPAWSPNGNEIAYADGGIRILNLTTNSRVDVIESFNFDNVGFENSPGQYGTWFHNPIWAPNGEALLFSKQTPTSPTRMLFSLPDKMLRQVPGTLGVHGNNISWSHDGSALLLDYWWEANVAPIPGIDPAFVRISRHDLEAQVLWSYDDRTDPVYASLSNQVLYPFETSDGWILFFQVGPCDNLPCRHYSLVEGVLSQDGFETRVLRQNALPEGVHDAVWHDSGNFVVFLTNPGSEWLISVMHIDTGRIFLLARESERPWPIIWGQ